MFTLCNSEKKMGFNFVPPAFKWHHMFFAIYAVIIFWFDGNILMKVFKCFVINVLHLVFYCFKKFEKNSPSA